MSSQLQAIVVGDSSDDFIRSASNLLDNRGFDIVRCCEIYSSVPKLGEIGGGVVVGRFEELCKEDGRFFEIAKDYGFTCCCFVGGYLVQSRGELIRAMEQGVLLVSNIEEVEEALESCSRGMAVGQRRRRDTGERGLVGNVVNTILGGTAPQRARSRAKSGFSKEEFRMTQAELDALLGG